MYSIGINSFKGLFYMLGGLIINILLYYFSESGFSALVLEMCIVSIVSSLLYFKGKYNRQGLFNVEFTFTFGYLFQFIFGITFSLFLYFSINTDDRSYSLLMGKAPIAIILIQLFLLMFSFGYSLVNYKVDKNPFGSISMDNIKRLHLIIGGLFFLVLLSRLYLLSTGTYYHVGSSDFMFSNNKVYSSLAQIISFRSFYLIFYTYTYVAHKRYKYLFILAHLFEIAYNLPTGARSGLYYAILPSLFTYVIVKPKLNYPILIGIIVLSIVSVALIKKYSSIGYNEEILSHSEIESQTIINTYKQSWDELGDEYSENRIEFMNKYFGRINDGLSFLYVLRDYDNRYDYKYGETYLSSLYFFIPRIIYPDKPILITPLNNYFPEVGGGSMPLTFVGEVYINFGILGFLFIPFFFGLLIAYIMRRIYYRAKSNLLYFLLFVSMVSNFLRFNVETFSVIIASIFWYSLLAFLINLVIKKKKYGTNPTQD